MNHNNTILEFLQSVPGDRTAIILPDGGRRVSYALLREQVMQLAEGLCAAGVGPEDRVATVFGAGLPAIVTFLAGAVAGAVAPLNPALRAKIDETVLLVLITEQGENRNQCEEQRNIFGFSHGFACR